MAIPLLIMAVLIVLNAVFVAAEFAIVGAPRAAIDARAVRKQPLARLVQSVLRDPRRVDRYIATAQIGITVASLGLGMYGEHVLADWILARALGRAPLAQWLAAHGFASLVALAILTYFHIVLGEMVPKSLALSDAEQIVLWITPPMLWLQTILLPLVVLLNAIGNRVLKVAGISRQARNTDQYYTAEELQLIVQEPEEQGALREDAGQMLRELFAFGDRTAGEVMVPRVRISGIPVGSTPRSFAPFSGLHRIPAIPCTKAISITSSACITSRICCGCCSSASPFPPRVSGRFLSSPRRRCSTTC